MLSSHFPRHKCSIKRRIDSMKIGTATEDRVFERFFLPIVKYVYENSRGKSLGGRNDRE